MPLLKGFPETSILLRHALVSRGDSVMSSKILKMNYRRDLGLIITPQSENHKTFPFGTSREHQHQNAGHFQDNVTQYRG